MARTLQSPATVAARARGFTLIELMIVVVIVAILASLAVFAYRKIIQSSHVTEATSMVNNLRVAQEAYHAETQSYAGCMSSLTAGWYPQPPSYGVLSGWGGSCTWCQAGQHIDEVLPVHVDGPVLFGYVTIAGTATSGGGVPTSLSGNKCGVQIGTAPTVDYYAIGAEADLDGNSGDTTDVCAFSFTNQVFVVNEGL